MSTSPDRERNGPGSAPSNGQRPGDEAQPGSPQSGEHICPECEGTGRKADVPCEACGGTGRITAIVGDA